ncbi:MAG: Bax inhibitor-1/YccA family protein [Proteobacteria bacterium]|nr:Bax inhibitor-1/YccA family protein [Pseudomonadota bacterium]
MENKTFSKSEELSNVDAGLRQYMIKVYNFMAAGLCLTALTAYIIANTSLLGLFFNINPAGQVTGMSGFGWLMFIAPLVMVFAFGWVVNRGTAAQVQALFWGYAAVMGASLTPIFLAYTGASVARVFLITAGMFGGMSIYGYTTKRDLSAMGSFLFMGLIGIIIATIVNFFLKSPGLYYAISFIAILVFTGLTAFDTQRIRQIYSEYDNSEIMTKKAVAGALSLYLDFINMFIYLLQFFGDRR